MSTPRLTLPAPCSSRRSTLRRCSPRARPSISALPPVVTDTRALSAVGASPVFPVRLTVVSARSPVSVPGTLPVSRALLPALVRRATSTALRSTRESCALDTRTTPSLPLPRPILRRSPSPLLVDSLTTVSSTRTGSCSRVASAVPARDPSPCARASSRLLADPTPSLSTSSSSTLLPSTDTEDSRPRRRSRSLWELLPNKFVFSRLLTYLLAPF
mmetsp:Transcript_8102/g.11254  ORF Transcript_8102/g.11254 Transcript_8102/m.11254 type:complete len:215 (+) Transcript_8102:583-1227(+)